MDADGFDAARSVRLRQMAGRAIGEGYARNPADKISVDLLHLRPQALLGILPMSEIHLQTSDAPRVR